ncbi:MAG: SGNH/GDSL hydrolase family protein [Parvibaculaceae bacterium]
MESSDISDAEGRPSAASGGSSRYRDWGIALLSLVISLILAEILFRLAAGVPVFSFSNWRKERVIANHLGDRAIVDPILGWKLKTDYRSDGFNTIAEGIRRNFDEADIRTGSILAVGDSFTEGWDEVRDEESWPAQLEKLIGEAVVNGGIGGYASDQIVLRAEQLIPVVSPKTLIIGMNEIDIFRSAHAPFGAPKPYFTIADGALQYHPPEPIENPQARNFAVTWLREALGYSAAMDFILGRLALDFWYGDTNQVYRRVHNDEVAVTCKLLHRLKAETDKRSIRTLLFMQYYGSFIVEEDEISENAYNVEACARDAGIEVIDQYAPLRQIALADPRAIRSYYVMTGDEFGHMSPKGNAHAAALVAEALKR